MSEQVTIRKEVTVEMDVDVYSVVDNNGENLDFEANVDSDGDIIIELDEVMGDLSFANIRDHLADEDKLTEFIDDSCDEYCEVAFTALLTKDKAYEWLEKHVSTKHKCDLVSALLYNVGNVVKEPV